MTYKKFELPKSKKKKIDINKFEKLAKKIKRYFEEEDKYLESESNGNSNSPRVFQNS